MNEAELLFSEALNCDWFALHANEKNKLDKRQAQFISSALRRRLKGEPLQYILGKTEFMGLEFGLTPDVLIPRPETEILVEKTIELASSFGRNIKILDLGTGSGCIAISLAKMLPDVQITATDISFRALEVAQENAKFHGVLDKINFMQSDLFEFVGTEQCSVPTFDFIISNPPYVETDQINKLQVELSYEPLISLDGGRDGLDFYRRITQEAGSCLRKNGYLILEIGFNQEMLIENIFQKSKNFEIIEVIKDYNKIDRIIATKKIV